MVTRSFRLRRPLALAIAMSLAAGSLHAATLTVTTAADSDPSLPDTCTLRQAIESANGGTSNIGNCGAGDSGADTIVFAAGLSGSTITLVDKLGVVQPLTIVGSNQDIVGPTGSYALFDSSVLTLSDLTIRGTDNSGHSGGALRIQNGNLTLNNVTLSGNTASSGAGISGGGSACALNLTNTVISNNAATGSSSQGGGIFSTSCTMTLINSTISGNTAAIGGGINALYGTLNATGSTISGNTAIYSGGGIQASGSGLTINLDHSTLSGNTLSTSSSSAFYRGGGLSLSSYGQATLTASTVSNNGANTGGGIAAYSHATLTVTDSTFSGNTQVDTGGAIALGSSSTATVTNSTLSGNAATYGGAIYLSDNAELTLNNTTVSGNTAYTAGGVESIRYTQLSLNNSIVSGNTLATSGGSNPDIGNFSGTVPFSASHSLLGSGVSPDAGQNNIFSDAPGLNALADNGGPTQTMALQAGSAALDAGDNAAIPPGVSNDQRGAGYPRIVKGNVDIGAYESAQDTIFANGFEPVP